jgi:cell division transport system ATP-binding protein
VLQEVGLTNKSYKMPHELSGGEQQRVVIARALLNNPDLILADEPTGNLDPETSRGIIELLEKVNEVNNTTVVVVTHDREVVQKYKKRTILIEDGCVKTDTSTGGYV